MSIQYIIPYSFDNNKASMFFSSFSLHQYNKSLPSSSLWWVSAPCSKRNSIAFSSVASFAQSKIGVLPSLSFAFTSASFFNNNSAIPMLRHLNDQQCKGVSPYSFLALICSGTVSQTLSTKSMESSFPFKHIRCNKVHLLCIQSPTNLFRMHREIHT